MEAAVFFFGWDPCLKWVQHSHDKVVVLSTRRFNEHHLRAIVCRATRKESRVKVG
jgi:mRNA-degrading endonuclease toxin of MazEF toxin-antitoxin module